MKIALVDTNKKTKFYPFGLLKIGNMLKSKGHTVNLFLNSSIPVSRKDEVWLSTLFTFDTQRIQDMILRSKILHEKVFVGGISATLIPESFSAADYVHIGLHKDAEKYAADYSLLPEAPKYSIAKTTNGCIRNCGFCAVNKLEPNFVEIENWKKDIFPGTEKLLLYDNNWTAKSKPGQEKDVEILKSYNFRTIDFNQGLDCRLFNDRIGNLLSQIPVKPLRFAFDGMHENGYFQDAIKTAVKYGIKDIKSYTMYNFNDTIHDMYYRLREIARLQTELWPNNPGLVLTAYPMCYNPILNTDSKNYIGKHWTQKTKSNFKRISSYLSFGGHLFWGKAHFKSPLHKFEHFFGKDDDEFVQLLNNDNALNIIKSKRKK